MVGKIENNTESSVGARYCMVCKCHIDDESNDTCHIPGCCAIEGEACSAYEFNHSSVQNRLQAHNEFYRLKASEDLDSDEVEVSVFETRKMKHFPLLKHQPLPKNLILGKGKWNLFIGVVLALFGSYTLLLELIHFPNVNILRLLVLTFLFFAPCFWVLYHYLRNRKILQIDESGIRLGKDLISWDDVHFTYFRKEWFKKENALHYYFVVNCLPRGDDREVRVIWDMRNEELGHYIECYKEKYSPYL